MSGIQYGSQEAEQLVLGACLCDPKMVDELAPILMAEEFYEQRHRQVWNAMLRLYERKTPVDLVLVLNELEAMNDPGDPVYLAELISYVEIPSHARYHAKVVQDLATRRRMLDAVRQAASRTFDQSVDVEEMLAEVERQIVGAATNSRRREAKTMHEIIDQYVATFDEGPGPLIEFGVPNVDDMIGGIPRRNLVIIAGRPSMGKSAYAVHVALHNARRGKRVIYLNLETDEEELFARFASHLTKINSRKIAMKGMALNGEYSILEEAMALMRDLPIVIDCNSTGDLADVVSRARHLHQREAADLVIVDHMALMTASGLERNRVQEMSAISRGMKRLAMEIERPVIALHQLSRAGSGRGDPRPILTDLRDSGTIEQDGDIICFLYREGYYKLGVDPEQTELIVAKYRNGPTGQKMMRYDMRHNTFWPPQDYRTTVNGYSRVNYRQASAALAE